MLGEALQLEVWDRLIQGVDLAPLGLARHEGRIDLRSIVLPERIVFNRFAFQGHSVARIDPAASIRNARWRDLDFGGAKLNGLRLLSGDLQNCSFKNAEMHDFRVWATRFNECTFEKCDLQGSMLGGVEGGRNNLFISTIFDGSNLSSTVYQAAAFQRCTFRAAKLRNVNFQSTTFSDCVFSGVLRNVQFFNRAPTATQFPENEMKHVDLHKAELHGVSFFGLTLETAKLPQDENQIVVEDAWSTIESIRLRLKLRGSEISEKIDSYLDMFQQWLPLQNARLPLNLKDMAEAIGEDAVCFFLRELRRSD